MPGQPDLDCARAADVAVQVSLLLQRGQLVGDAGRAGQPDRLADFPHRGRVSALLHRFADNLQYLALPPGEDVIGVRLIRRLGDDDRNRSLRFTAGSSLWPDGHLGAATALDQSVGAADCPGFFCFFHRMTSGT